MALLSHIVHFLNVEKDRVLLRKIYDSLPDENGVILISEWLLNDEKTGPVPPALTGLAMIVDMPEGRNYSYAESFRNAYGYWFHEYRKETISRSSRSHNRT